ncbi:hypothetical protein GCM10022225_51310 [Plantactinospora mayteni]|uniref:Uncharacterized protein n=1 Tax=Plantactinospora mayteni TaxID=566021 RepID=A0ABQ4F484_9ACTN|nr:hypothetical protein Pma05_82620 [Plantactinospora mayteni]
MQRRRFLQDVFVTALAVEAALDWRDMPPAASVARAIGTRVVTAADVNRLWQARTEFAQLDHILGGGYALSWLVQHLDTEVAPLLNGAC